MGKVQTADAQRERNAWAEHCRKIGEGAGEVEDQVWADVPFYSAMHVVWGDAPAPNELHAALRQMSLGKAAGEDGVTAELLEFGGPNLWEGGQGSRAQWLLLIEAPLVKRFLGPKSGVLVLLSLCGNARAQER